MGRPDGALRPRRRPQRARTRDARTARRRRPRHPPPRLPERPAAPRRRSHGARARRHPRLQGSPRRGRGDPLEPVDRDAGPHVEWRLGYLPDAEVDRALGEATVAVFPYRPELDQSGALLRALGAGVPAVAYDVGGIAEPIKRFGAGRVVPAGDVAALAGAIESVLADPGPARAGAQRAREELTWDASARAHLELYEEIA
ncbi:MAG: glycosyltransferase [Actinomycetota bacterium]